MKKNRKVTLLIVCQFFLFSSLAFDGDTAAAEMLNYFHIPFSDGSGEGDVKTSAPTSFEHKGKGKYELHAWAWKENPNGPFMHFNPNVSCEKAKCRQVVHKDGSKTWEGECSQLSKK